MITIRSYKPSDLQEISLVHKKASEQKTKFYTAEQVTAMTEVYQNKIEDQVNASDNLSLTALFDNKTVGYVIYDTRKQWVWAMFVHPTYQSKGVGKALLSEIEKRAKKEECSFIGLYARLSAITFYEHLHFEQISEYDWDIEGVHVPLIEMRKALE